MMSARLRLNHALMAAPSSSTIYGPTTVRPDREAGSAWLARTASAAASRITAGTASNCRIRRTKGFNGAPYLGKGSAIVMVGGPGRGALPRAESGIRGTVGVAGRWKEDTFDSVSFSC